MQHFLRKITRGHRLYITGIVAINVMEVFFTLLFVWLSKTIIDVATGGIQGSLLHYSLAIVALTILQVLVRTLDTQLRNVTEARLANSIRYHVFGHLLYVRWVHLPELHNGDVLTRLTRDADDVVRAIVTSLPLASAALIQLVAAVGLLFYFDPTLAVILGVGVPFLALLSKLYYVRMRRYTQLIKQTESRINTLIEESLLNQLVIRTFDKQQHTEQRLHGMQDELNDRVHHKANVSAMANGIAGAAFSGGYISAFLWSAYSLSKGFITFGTVTAYLQMVVRIQRPVRDLIRLVPSLITAKTAWERLDALMHYEQESKVAPILPEGSVSLTISHLTFAYQKESDAVLNDFSLDLTPGSMVAVMGHTGVGKTTLLRLLLALISPQAGEIYLRDSRQNRIPISEATRANFVYVPQGNTLFSGTIRENLLIGDENASDERLYSVLDMASASFVRTLPMGLDSSVGEGGVGLSEGQAQRLAIARSLLRPGKILLFDEATSALDVNTETKIIDRLRMNLKDRIVIFVTHHPQVAERSDRVVHL